MAVVVGIAISCASSCVNALGLNVQKLGQQPRYRSRRILGLNLNLVGVVLSVCSGIMDLISFGFAPQSVLAPLSAVTLIVNLLLAPVIHKESLTKTDIISTICVCFGVAICLSSNPSNSVEYSYESLTTLIFRKSLVIYFVLYASVLAFLGNRIIQGESSGRGHLKSIGVGYPVMAGMFGGMTTLFAKISTELTRVTNFGMLTATFVVMLACSALSQIVMLNRGLGLHSSLFVGPMFTATFVIFNIGNGGVVFREFDSFSPSQFSFFLLGIGLIVGGVTILATKDAGTNQHKVV